MDARKIGAFIAAARRARGLTQQQLAEQLGVTNRAVSKWETGQGLPDIALLPALAAALGVTADALLAGGEALPGAAEAPAGDEAAPGAAETPEGEAEGTAPPAGEPVLAAIPRRQPTRDELNAAVLTCRQLPAVRMRRLAVALLGVAGLAAGIGLSLQSFFDGSGTEPLTVAALAAGLVLLAFAALTPWLRSRLWRDLCRLPGCTLFSAELRQEEGSRLPLAELALVRRYRGCTVLVWDWGLRPLVVTVPDDTCTDSAHTLYDHLARQAPAVCGGSTPRSARMHPLPVLAALAVAAAVVFPLALAPELGFAGTVSPTGTLLMLRRDPETGLVTDLHSGETFPYPVVGPMKKQWMTGDCCAVTYQTTDGSTHVFLATYGDRGSGLSYYNVAPLLQGAWRQYEDALDPGMMLRNEPGSLDIRILSDAASPDYSQTYSRTVQFGTLGVALCDEEGLPHWTVVLGRDFDASDGPDPDGTLILCPVSMSATEAVTLHYYSAEDQDRDLREAMGLPSPEEEAAQQAQQAALADTPPSFSGEKDYTVRADGVYFTWDGGETFSKAMEGSEEVRTTDDIQPCVMTDTLGAFLTVSRSGDIQEVDLHLTRDRGGYWQTTPLATFPGLHDVSQRSLGFLDDDFGWYSVCTDWSMGTGIGMVIGTTRDGGITWQRRPPPGEEQSKLLTGVVFYDEDTAVATRCSQFEAGWIDVYVSEDGGDSWQQAAMPWDSVTLPEESKPTLFADRELYWLNKVSALEREGDQWQLTLTQAPDGRQEALFTADSLTGPWTLAEVRSAG